MCSSQGDNDPTTYDAPYDPEPPASIALAVLGTMLQESEHDLDGELTPTGRNYIGQRIAILRDVRDRIADAEALEENP